MRPVRELPWLRILAEGSAIVVSILLAFAIDAWWQRQKQLEQVATLVTGLHSDFVASQAHAEQWMNGNRKILDALTRFRDALAAAPAGEQVTVPLEWVVAAVGAPTYSPTDATLRMAVSSGQVELIENVELRIRLAEWRQQLDDTQEDELLIREIVVHHLVPALSEQVRLAKAFEFDSIVGWFLDDPDLRLDGTVQVTATPRLEGALAERVFYATFVVDGLGDIRDRQAEILRLLED